MGGLGEVHFLESLMEVVHLIAFHQTHHTHHHNKSDVLFRIAFWFCRPFLETKHHHYLSSPSILPSSASMLVSPSTG